MTAAGDPRWLDDREQQTWRAYLMASAWLNVKLAEDLRPFGIDLNEYEVLVCLSEAPDRSLRMSELAEQAHQSRSRLTHTVTRLEHNGFVTRKRSPHDRRGVSAVLTDEGLALLQKAAPGHVNAVRRYLVDPIGPDDFAALGRAMEASLEAMRD